MISPEKRAEFTGQLRRRRGRPRSAAPTVVTSVKIPVRVYDALCKHAAVERQSVHSVLQDALESFVRGPMAHPLQFR